MPRGGESPKMIQTNSIHMREERAQPIDRSSIPRGTQRIPVINRVAPQLTLRAEIVRRDACDETWPTLVVEKK